MDFERIMLSLLTQEEYKHAGELKGSSGKGASYEEGFIAGLKHCRENLLPLATQCQHKTLTDGHCRHCGMICDEEKHAADGCTCREDVVRFDRDHVMENWVCIQCGAIEEDLDFDKGCKGKSSRTV